MTYTADTLDYTGAEIVNIRRGKGAREKYIYAQIKLADGTIAVSATLDYCAKALAERLPCSPK